MTNSLRLTHHVLLVRDYMFRSLVTIIRPFFESILKMLDYILGSQVCLQYVYGTVQPHLRGTNSEQSSQRTLNPRAARTNANVALHQ